MLRQEMKSYPLIILAWAHNKYDNKLRDDSEFGREIGPQIYMLLQMGFMALVWSLKI